MGRADDVFKASDYRISPFELESVLLEHPAVAEAAVVPSPDALRLAVPKAYVVLAAGCPRRDSGRGDLRHSREQLAPVQAHPPSGVRDLPKTISGKIRRVELREREDELHRDPTSSADGRGEVSPASEFRIEDFPELR